jgi:integrase
MNSLHYNSTSVVVVFNLQAGSQFGVASPPYYFVLSYIVTNEVLAYLSNSSIRYRRLPNIFRDLFNNVSQILLSGKSYRNFIEAVHSPFTRHNYKNSLSLYMRHRKVESCDQLLQEDPKVIEGQLIDYIIHMREELKIVSATINTRIAPIRKFYDTNDIELRWKKIKSYVGRNKSKRNKKDRPYTRLEIQKMLEKADQRGRVTILLMASTGMRVGAIPLLKIRNLERIEKYSLYKVTVYENEDEEYITFCTPECSKEIESYLEYRQRIGEYPLKEDSPLIREEFNISDEIRAARPKVLGVETFKKMIRSIGLRSGVIEKRAIIENGRGPRRPVKETHGFRKFFQTSTIGNGMSPLYSEFLMGHLSGGLALESYVRPSVSDLLEGNDKMLGYTGVIDALTINEENKLRLEVHTLKQEVNKFDHMQKQIEELSRRMSLG